MCSTNTYLIIGLVKGFANRTLRRNIFDIHFLVWYYVFDKLELNVNIFGLAMILSVLGVCNRDLNVTVN